MVGNSGKFQILVRLGYLSRAIFYSLAGILALTSRNRLQEGANGIFGTLEDFPAGMALLGVLAVGLAGYALFRICSFLFDVEHRGNDRKAMVKRLGHAASAVAHCSLAYSAFKLVTSQAKSNDGGGRAQEIAAGVLTVDLGGIVLGIVGLGFLLAAFMQAKSGITGSFMDRISPMAPAGTRVLGTIGMGTRAIVFAVIGWSLIRSGWFSRSSEVKTLGDAIISLSDNGILYSIVAIGLLVFGLFSAVLSRYRYVPDVDFSEKVPT